MSPGGSGLLHRLFAGKTVRERFDIRRIGCPLVDDVRLRRAPESGIVFHCLGTPFENHRFVVIFVTVIHPQQIGRRGLPFLLIGTRR